MGVLWSYPSVDPQPMEDPHVKRMCHVQTVILEDIETAKNQGLKSIASVFATHSIMDTFGCAVHVDSYPYSTLTAFLHQDHVLDELMKWLRTLPIDALISKETIDNGQIRIGRLVRIRITSRPKRD